ncbi:hypothetical protein SPHINGOAX6_70125 [Sphingomonas sp. AX6]|nr:hypothetical protein SPHINGOAX6_70125 [Sphingomonas sp. AX6]
MSQCATPPPFVLSLSKHCPFLPSQERQHFDKLNPNGLGGVSKFESSVHVAIQHSHPLPSGRTHACCERCGAGRGVVGA